MTQYVAVVRNVPSTTQLIVDVQIVNDPNFRIDQWLRGLSFPILGVKEGTGDLPGLRAWIVAQGLVVLDMDNESKRCQFVTMEAPDSKPVGVTEWLWEHGGERVDQEVGGVPEEAAPPAGPRDGGPKSRRRRVRPEDRPVDVP